MSYWLVTTADMSFRFGSACLVEADTIEEAIGEGFAWIEDETDSEEPPHTAVALPWNEPDIYRAKYAAERVPDEFQCCGGMPNLSGPGAHDEHSGICKRVRQ